MKPYERPSKEACERALKTLCRATEYLDASLDEASAEQTRETRWSRTIGYLQDGLAELGLDIKPLKQPAPATPEAYGPHDYAASRGQ